MLISMGVTGIVVALVAHAAAGHLRFFRGVGEAVSLRGQIGHASGIAAGLLWSVSSAGGDIVVAQDSAIELRMSIGAAITCASELGHAVIPAASDASGNALSAFVEPPDAGDRAIALFEDSLGATWLTLHVAAPPVAGAGCATFPSAAATWTIALQEQLIVPAGAALRFTRPIRLSLYRAADARWYLGAKTWNAAAQRFNVIQPVAGPLNPYSSNPTTTGFLLTYRDSAGVELPPEAERIRIASVTVVARAQSARQMLAGGPASKTRGAHEDSTSLTIALRNSR
jgi:hypothetical protein